MVLSRWGSLSEYSDCARSTLQTGPRFTRGNLKMRRAALLLFYLAIFSGLELVAMGGENGAASVISPAELRTEYAVEPLALETAKPRFTWQLRAHNTSDRGLRQTAFEIMVASSAESLRAGTADMWDTGRVSSDATAQVEYAGKLLASRSEY